MIAQRPCQAPTRTSLITIVACLFATAVHAQEPRLADAAAEFPKPHNTQELSAPLLSHQEALSALNLPHGFAATMFAGEPDVQQPIAMTFDTRGRLWVAENYTYAERALNHDLSLRDRIVILEDEDGDGQFDQRTVFWDRGQRLTSIEVGFGGVWALCAPHLLYIPDRNGDDRPDDEAIIVLDGWAPETPRHNFVNGLKWGPDGWLYGRHGITDSSLVGLPSTPDAERVLLNCSIWRVHPITKEFEVVCQGTTNPWGSDWDDYGEMFFINTVIGHLWHAVPGAYLQRMFGEHFRPHLYEMIEQTADHFHWDQSEVWQDVRTGLSESSNQLGGGHAHTGMMIYLGDNWPAEYRNDVFTWNLHGRRMNRDALERRGATYVGLHRPDPIASRDIWFRGIEVAYGPDGGVYVLDWSDLGECHENDGVHRSSGRIFKITWGEDQQPGCVADLAQLTSQELVALQEHRNDWFVRQARRVLQERFAAGQDLTAARQDLFKIYEDNPDVTRRLRGLWCLHVTGGVGRGRLFRALEEEDEHLRAWAVQLLTQTGIDADVLAAFVDCAHRESSGLVLTYLASSLQRLPLAERGRLAAELVRHDEFAEDKVFPLMVWYGMEPTAASMPAEAISVLRQSRLPKVTQFLARRLTHEMETAPAGVAGLINGLASSTDSHYRLAILQGMEAALRGWHKVRRPAGWESVAGQLAVDPLPAVRSAARRLAAVFGDGHAIEELQSLLANPAED